jgi:hypothetical protein
LYIGSLKQAVIDSETHPQKEQRMETTGNDRCSCLWWAEEHSWHDLAAQKIRKSQWAMEQ